MKKLLLSINLATLVLLFACGEETGHVEATMPPCTLTVLDSVGVELGDSAYVFGAILGLEFMPGGGFAVLDRVSRNVRLYDDRGVYQTTIAGSGSGPGEIVQPYGLFVWSNGDIGIMDPYRGGLQKFTREGEYLGTVIDVTRNVPLNPRMVGDTGYVAYRTRINPDGDNATVETFLGYFPMTWEPSHKYLSSTVPMDLNRMADFFLEQFFYSFWAVDRVNGLVYAAPFDEGEYRILAFPLEGGEPEVIEMETSLVPKTDAEIEMERAFVAEYLTAAEGGEAPYNMHCEPWPYRLPIAGMEVDDTGNLWVLRGNRDDVIFDVWDRSGTRVAECLLQGLEGGDLNFRIRGRRMIIYRENPPDYQKIYIAQIPLEGIPGR